MGHRLLTLAMLLAFGGAVPSHASAAAGETHWRVELKVWIPFAHVADPAAPPAAARHSARKCAIPGSRHIGYEGGFQVLRWVDFTVGRSGDAARVVSADERGRPGRAVCATGDQAADDVTSYSVLRRSRTAGAWDSLASPGDLELHVAAKLPARSPWASPTIRADVALVLANAGPDGRDRGGHRSSLAVQYRTTRFPSIGLKVEANGQTRATLVVNDASCIRPVLGVAGAANLARGLVRASNRGELSIGNHALLPSEQPARDAIGRTHYVGGGYGYDIDSAARAQSGLCSGQDISAFFPR